MNEDLPLPEDLMNEAYDILPDLESHMSAVYEIEDEIKRLTQQRKEVLASIQSDTLQHIAKIQCFPEAMRAEVFSLYYWCADQHGKKILPSERLASACGFANSYEARKILKQVPSGFHCGECGCEIPVTSFDAKRRLLSLVRQAAKYEARNGTHLAKKYSGLTCNRCAEARFAQWRGEHEARLAQIELDQQELRRMPYAAYLRTDHWQTVRASALTRAKGRCQVCGAEDRPLDVHHNSYRNRGREQPADVIALCRPCHEKHHDVMVKSGVEPEDQP